MCAAARPARSTQMRCGGWADLAGRRRGLVGRVGVRPGGGAGLIDWPAERGGGFSDWGPACRSLPAPSCSTCSTAVTRHGAVSHHSCPAGNAADRASCDVGSGNVCAGWARSGRLKGRGGHRLGVRCGLRHDGRGAGRGRTRSARGHARQPDDVGVALRAGWRAGRQQPPQDKTGHAFRTKRGMGMYTTIGGWRPTRRDHGGVERSLPWRRRATPTRSGPSTRPMTAKQCPPRNERVPLPEKPDPLLRVGTIAGDVVARAAMRGVYEARSLGDIKGYAET